MALAILSVDVTEVGEALSGIRIRYAALGVVLFLCSAFVGMVRFRVVLGKFGYSPVWRQLFGAFSIGLIGNQFVLNVIGQSVGRAGVLTSSGVPFGATILATLAERVLAAGILAAAGVAAAWFLLPQFGFDFAQGGAYFLSLAGGMAVAAFAAAAVAHRRGGAARANAMLSKGIERFWTAMILTILAHLFMLGFHAAMLLALNIEALTLEIASALVIVMFVSSLPISLGGWGVRELSAVAALGAVGIEPSAALAAALLVGIFSLGANLAIAFPGVFLVLNSRLAREPGTQHANGTLNWNSRLVTGCAVLMAVAIFFQVRLETGSGQLTANAADLLALMGLASLILFMAESRDCFAALPRPLMGALLALSLVLVYGLMLGYVNFGANTWAVVNRGIGWVIILGYVAVGLSIALVDAERGRRFVLRLFVAAGTAVAALQLVLLVALKLGFPLPSDAFHVPLRATLPTGMHSDFRWR